MRPLVNYNSLPVQQHVISRNSPSLFTQKTPKTQQFKFQQIVFESHVSRYRPCMKKAPLFIDRYLQLTKSALIYYKQKPISTNSSKPLLQVPISEIKCVRELQQPTLKRTLFEVVLKNDNYEQLYLVDSVLKNSQRDSNRLSQVPLKEILLRQIPDAKVNKRGIISNDSI
jgi:hypothetical protein